MDYFREQFYPTYKKLGMYIDIDYFPYGNAKMEYHPSNSSYTFKCQHGPEECVGNKIQGCLRHEFHTTFPPGTSNDYGRMAKQLQVINCVMGTSMYPFGRLFYCLDEADLEISHPHILVPFYKRVLDCFAGNEGDKVMAKIGHATMELEPKHEYVPWVTVDGKHEPEAEKNLGQFLCKGKLKHVPECKGMSSKQFKTGKSWADTL